MSGTIQDWEDRRFAEEALAEIEAVETVEPVRALEAATSVVPPADIVALCGRVNAGLSVQLLVTTGDDVRAWVTLDYAGKTETVEVAPESALDAYHHPYCYGATLALQR
jgi:hypothetical protein